MKSKKIIVIGNGMASHKFCEKIKSKSLPVRIQVFSEEPRRAYDRVHLSQLFNGKSADSLSLCSESWYDDNEIELNLGDAIVQIDRNNKSVSTASGRLEMYDYLVIATGSAPFVPPISGIEKNGVFVYRTIEDLERIRDYASGVEKASVLGGGLLGLEAAKALMDLNLNETHVVESAAKLMPRQVDDQGSKILESQLIDLGLQIYLNKLTIGIDGEKNVTALKFKDGSSLETDMLVVSAGIRPRDQLARDCGLVIGDRGGIVVNERMQSSDVNIYAIGECASFEDCIYGLVAPAYDMADVAVNSITGGQKVFKTFDMSTKLKLIGVDVASFGDPFISEPHARSIVFENRLNGIYKRINVSNDGKQLLGGILVGDASAYNLLSQTVVNNILLPPNPEDLIVDARTEKSASDGLTGLPDDAIICSCEGVTKGTICSSVSEQGCESVDAIKKCTGAGTGCGGCVPMVKDLMLYTMKSKGKYVRNVVCEHFDLSRQELYDLIKIHGLDSYNDVLDNLGSGDGCEICKPLVSSLLASIWNDMILKKGNDAAQDSNDRFLANIQKGGSYSVVPRIPGGEITPEKLIVIGNVAHKYGLYTKITGGQRIDMFGAHVKDLPFIWEELIAAGFESGHAYGKGLRTVKSCVGSTWCRFGLHDSVSFAIQIEERYKGLRAPHKYKSAVSGCIRECAEAQSKDFGIIATEKGWNLYVCGNGGSKPQHAKLLASDIDSATCIRYLDRFLMFYIQTADPLTRTATWLNKMDGGIEYLRNVIVNDSLGMAEKWEGDMDQFVQSYTCEWKAAVEDPDIRKRFNHFVNAPEETDPSIKFENMRGQKKAMGWSEVIV